MADHGPYYLNQEDQDGAGNYWDPRDQGDEAGWLGYGYDERGQAYEDEDMFDEDDEGNYADDADVTEVGEGEDDEQDASSFNGAPNDEPNTEEEVSEDEESSEPRKPTRATKGKEQAPVRQVAKDTNHYSGYSLRSHTRALLEQQALEQPQTDADEDEPLSDNEAEDAQQAMALENELQTYQQQMLAKLAGERDSANRGRGRPKAGKGGPSTKSVAPSYTPKDGDDPSLSTSKRVGRRTKQQDLGPEIRLLLTHANMAYVDHRYAEGTAALQSILQINPLVSEAWSLLGGLQRETGESESALMSLMNAALLSPSEPALWMDCVMIHIEKAEAEENREEKSRLGMKARHLLTRASKSKKNYSDVRIRLANLFVSSARPNAAVATLKTYLKSCGPDPEVFATVRKLVSDINIPSQGPLAYEKAFQWCGEHPDEGRTRLTWEDIGDYAEMFLQSTDLMTGIVNVRAIARWKVGREDQKFWDDVWEDDCEWDVDNTRRLAIQDFDPDEAQIEDYGMALPHFVRTKLAALRLRFGEEYRPEAEKHLQILQLAASGRKTSSEEHRQLQRSIGMTLFAAEQYKDALKYLKPAAAVDDEADEQLLLALGQTFSEVGQATDAIKTLKKALRVNPKSVDARVQLAEVHEEQGDNKQAFAYISEVIRLRKYSGIIEPSPYYRGRRKAAERAQAAEKILPGKGLTAEEKEELDKKRDAHVREVFKTLKIVEESVKSGVEGSVTAWLQAASALISDFRNCRLFYPLDKFQKFLGFSKEARRKRHKRKPEQEEYLSRMLDRLGNATAPSASREEELRTDQYPTSYRGILFDEWLDIFLRYALWQAQRGHFALAYDIMDAAADANLYYHSPESMFRINSCRLACALIGEDERTCNQVIRWMMQETRFSTDSFHLYAAIHRICKAPVDWYHSGASQKFLMRQLKLAELNNLPEGPVKDKFRKRINLPADGVRVATAEMNATLLTVYGQTVFYSGSYSHALNHFYRALSLDPENPFLFLQMGLCYLYHAIKRSAEDRHHSILEGFSFLQRYRDAMLLSDIPEERQAGELNLGRAFHTIGLSHLAIPCYRKVLAISTELEQNRGSMTDEDLSREAAYNLQQIYVVSGNAQMAMDITVRYLAY